MDNKPQPDPLPKATMIQVRGLIRRTLRRHDPHQEQALNIYPMMDMMTILLVFLIMQFAATTAETVQSEQLQIPYSTSDIEPEGSVSVQISRNEIVVDGDKVLTLRNGQVDPSQKQGGGTGFLVTPLLATMQQHRDRLKLIAQRNPQRAFRGEVQIIADKRTPFRTLAEVIYTLGQSEFRTVRFVVLKGGGA